MGLELFFGYLLGKVYFFDLDVETSVNGFRSLVYIVRCCLAYLLYKLRYVVVNRRSIFFRISYNLVEFEVYLVVFI